MRPANGSSVETATPLFDWSGLVDHVPNLTSYQFEIDSYFDFRAPLVSEPNLDSPQYTPTMSLTENDLYYWRFKTFDGTVWSEYSRTFAVTAKSPTAIDNDEPMVQLPEELILSQNSPNPFNPTTEISFSLPKASYTKLEIYNIAGKKVVTLVDEVLNSGAHKVVWNGRTAGNNEAASGLYFYRISTGDVSVSKKMLLLK